MGVYLGPKLAKSLDPNSDPTKADSQLKILFNPGFFSQQDLFYFFN
jgi:hypothetical protein